MYKKHGFTLIELLAVIIILAIVALIATPIILNVVEDARMSAGKSEAQMIYSGINNYCASSMMEEQLNGKVDICADGVTTEEVSQMVNLGNAIVNKVTYSNGKVTELEVESNNHTFKLCGDGSFVMDEEVCETSPEVTYNVGDLLKVQVSDSETQNIYVLEVNGDEIVGILDRNLPGGTVAWISEEDYNSAGGNWDSDDDATFNQNLYEFGPITANKALNERTSSWNKVNSVEMPTAEQMLKLTEYYKELESSGETSNWESKYFTDFYGFIQANESMQTCSSGSECREAITAAGGAKYLLPEWATINLCTTGDNSKGCGYWTSTPMNYSVVSYPDTALSVSGYGEMIDVSVYASVHAGSRPVIHIYQSNILEKLEAPEYVNPEDVGSGTV